MRVAPLGAFFGGEPARAAKEAQQSAIVTHAHPEGQAGAIAIAVAASLCADGAPPRGNEFLQAVAAHTPESETRSVLLRGQSLSPNNPEGVARVLGSGYEISSQDTVPFALFAVAHFLDSYEEALWWTVAGLGDRDTTCAIVGGVVALVSPPPAAWIAAREPLPDLSARVV
jgi:ADP-ribosylglycohydrolase